MDTQTREEIHPITPSWWQICDEKINLHDSLSNLLERIKAIGWLLASAGGEDVEEINTIGFMLEGWTREAKALQQQHIMQQHGITTGQEDDYGQE